MDKELEAILTNAFSLNKELIDKMEITFQVNFDFWGSIFITMDNFFILIEDYLAIIIECSMRDLFNHSLCYLGFQEPYIQVTRQFQQVFLFIK